MCDCLALYLINLLLNHVSLLLFEPQLTQETVDLILKSIVLLRALVHTRVVEGHDIANLIFT